VHNQEHKVKVPKQKVLHKEDAWCLPWSKEGKELASVKLGVPSKSMVLEPMLYDVSELMKDATVMKVRSTRLSYFKVIKDLSLSFPSLTPIS
jgi:hypothetical protein